MIPHEETEHLLDSLVGTLEARHLDLAEKYMRPDYIQHNPNADTGIAGFKAYFQRLGAPLPIQSKLFETANGICSSVRNRNNPR